MSLSTKEREYFYRWGTRDGAHGEFSVVEFDESIANTQAKMRVESTLTNLGFEVTDLSVFDLVFVR